MKPLSKGTYTVRRACGARDMTAVFAVRAVCFGIAGGAVDHFDTTATHVLVEQTATGQVVATFRMSVLEGAQIGASYAAQFYDLHALAAFDGPMLELGRFCIHPDHSDPHILRIAWAALTAFVDETAVALLFGCASFAGTQTAPYLDAFALLRARHLGPEQWRPRIKAAQVYRFGERLCRRPDIAKANAALPPLLRSYLVMGGWVSDHAVIDPEMGTVHVFTGLEIGAIPPVRKKLLRALV
jgi:putative hemolysin